MNIGLDWDGTVTNDVETFSAIVLLLRSKGHKVYIVTMRYPSEIGEIAQFVNRVDGVIFTSRKAKRPVTLEKGINIHVWIDDNPEAVHKTAEEIWGWSSKEGEVIDVKHIDTSESIKPD